MAFMFGRGRRASGSAQGYLGLPYVGSRMPGEGVDTMFNTTMTTPTAGNRVMSSMGLGAGAGAGRQTASFANYGPVLEARRQAKLAAADPGLSTRGRMGAPGRAARGVTGGLEGRGITPGVGTRRRLPTRSLEGRGVRPSAGSRMLPQDVGPMLGPGRRELAQVSTPAARVKYNVGRSQEARAARNSAAVRNRVRANVATSSAGRAERAAIKAQRAGSQSVINQMRTRSTPVSLRPRKPVGAGAGGDVVTKSVDNSKKINFAKMMEGRKGLLLAGAGAIGLGYALGGREKRGTSSGAQGAYR